MTITVNNHCHGAISVGINHWGYSGKTNYFEIQPGNTETWERDDPRGVIMMVETFGTPSWNIPYFVFKDSTIDVYNMDDWSQGQDVRDGGAQLRPAGQGGKDYRP